MSLTCRGVHLHAVSHATPPFSVSPHHLVTPCDKALGVPALAEQKALPAVPGAITAPRCRGTTCPVFPGPPWLWHGNAHTPGTLPFLGTSMLPTPLPAAPQGESQGVGAAVWCGLCSRGRGSLSPTGWSVRADGLLCASGSHLTAAEQPRVGRPELWVCGPGPVHGAASAATTAAEIRAGHEARWGRPGGVCPPLPSTTPLELAHCQCSTQISHHWCLFPQYSLSNPALTLSLGFHTESLSPTSTVSTAVTHKGQFCPQTPARSGFVSALSCACPAILG